MPGGVSSPVRAFGAVGGTPRFIAAGQGARVTDADGHSYIDLLGSWGPLILGHAHPAVVDAVAEAAALGTSFGAPTEGEVELAELIVSALPSVDMVRFVSSGTEATMSALRLARAATGRTKVLKFAGCYHGHVDALLVSAGSGVATPRPAGLARRHGRGPVGDRRRPYNSIEGSGRGVHHLRRRPRSGHRRAHRRQHGRRAGGQRLSRGPAPGAAPRPGRC